MKKHLLFSVIGGIIIFTWQFLTYAMPNFHKSAQTYTPLQDSIMQNFKDLGLEQGMYMLGMPNPDNQAEVDASWSEESSTWAILNYRINDSNSMGLPMFRSFVIGMLIAGLLFWLLKQKENTSLSYKILLSVVIGFMAFMYIPYSNYIWYKAPDIYAHLIDGIVPWAILASIGHLFLKPKKN